MKKGLIYFFIILLAAAGILPAGQASAEDSVKSNNGRPHWKEKADTNKDGIVDKAERDAAKEIHKEHQEARKETFKEKADKNGDGVVDNAERHAAKDARKEAFKEKADINKDGKVDKVEKREAKERAAEHRDHDNNPPGPKGGKGTDWENPPGPKGGPGASPNRHKK